MATIAQESTVLACGGSCGSPSLGKEVRRREGVHHDRNHIWQRFPSANHKIVHATITGKLFILAPPSFYKARTEEYMDIPASDNSRNLNLLTACAGSCVASFALTFTADILPRPLSVLVTVACVGPPCALAA